MSKFMFSVAVAASCCFSGLVHAGSHTFVCSSKMIGQPIYGSTQEQIADVNTIVLNREGQPLFIIAGVGGLVGVGETEVAVPWDAVKSETKVEDDTVQCRLMLPMTQEQMNKAPQLKAAEYAELSDKQWLSKNAEYFSAAAPQTVAKIDESICVSTISGCSAQCAGAQEPNATVKGLVFNTKSGKFEYAVIGYGGTVGLGQKHTAVPLAALDIKTNSDDEQVCHLPCTQKELEKQPVVSPSELPELELESVRNELKMTEHK